MDIGCAGNDDVKTPTMDALSDTGTQLSHAYSTHPICGPSRAALISGQYPTTNGVLTNEFPLAKDAPSIAKAFQEAGYRTGYVGKWHLDGVPRDKWTPPGPRRHGFDDFWAVHNCVHDYFNPQYYRDSPNLIREEGYEPSIQTDLAIEFIEADDDRPFCLFVSWGPPHDPYRLVPAKYRTKYDSSELHLRPNAEPILPGHNLNLTTGNVDAPPVREWGERVSPDSYSSGEQYNYNSPRECYADYYASVSAIDNELGRLVDTLDQQNLNEQTILAYSSDHGDLLYSHGNNQKGTPHEEAIRIPFIIRWPGKIPDDTVNDTLLGIVDVAPTLISLANVEIPSSMEGRDLSAELRDPSNEGPEYLFLYGENWRAVRTHRYMYACVPNTIPEFSHLPRGHLLLFDMETDPYQRHNLVWESSHTEIRNRLRNVLDKWLAANDDPFLSLERMVDHLGRNEDWSRRRRYIAGELDE